MRVRRIARDYGSCAAYRLLLLRRVDLYIIVPRMPTTLHNTWPDGRHHA